MKIAVISTAVVGLITLVTVAAPYILPVIQNRNLWAAISLIAVLLFTSGHMFNHIRGVPYVGGDGKGHVSYFAGGFQNQFGMETQIVAAMCEFSTVPLARGNVACGVLIDLFRRHPLFRHHQPSTQGAPHDRPPQPTDRRVRLVRRHPGNVLVLAQCVPNQEWRLPVLAATVLDFTARREIAVPHVAAVMGE